MPRSKTSSDAEPLRFSFNSCSCSISFDGRGTATWYTGRTYDISTTGVNFRCNEAVPVNGHIEVVIDWPSKQSTLHPICLRAAGHVVRSEDGKVAVWMTSCRMVIEKPTSPAVNAAPSSGM